MINYTYADTVYRRGILADQKSRTLEEDKEFMEIGKTLTKMELDMSSKDIIDSVREAWKHIQRKG